MGSIMKEYALTLNDSDIKIVANNIKSNIGSATLYNTNVSLENMGIIKKVQKGEYEIVDIFLEILLQQTQDAMV